MNRFSQLNANPSLRVAQTRDVGVAPTGFEVGPFSQLNHATPRPSSQSNPGALNEAHAFASLGDILAFSQLNAIPSLEVTWAEEAGAVIGPKYLNRRSYLHVSDEPRTTRGSVHLEPKF